MSGQGSLKGNEITGLCPMISPSLMISVASPGGGI